MSSFVAERELIYVLDLVNGKPTKLNYCTLVFRVFVNEIKKLKYVDFSSRLIIHIMLRVSTSENIAEATF